jgi:NADPH:quinone reductase-like Zn-dependent oxidoreductase
LIRLGSAAGIRVWVTGRSAGARAWALRHGAAEAFESGARLPRHVDAVMETVGQATWGHSLRCLRAGGRVVVAGATSGGEPPAELQRLFFRQLQVLGARMGTLAEFESLLRLLGDRCISPPVDSVVPLPAVEDGLRAMVRGDLRGKVVVDTTAGA